MRLVLGKVFFLDDLQMFGNMPSPLRTGVSAKVWFSWTQLSSYEETQKGKSI